VDSSFSFLIIANWIEMLLNDSMTTPLLRMERRCNSPKNLLRWMVALVICLIASPGVFLLTTAAPLVMPDFVDPVPIPEDFVANELPKTVTNLKDDSTIKLDLSDFTDAELIRLAKVLQKELESSPTKAHNNKAPPRIGFQHAPAKLQEPIWIVPVSIAEDEEGVFPRDRRALVEQQQPVLLLDPEPQQVVENGAPVEYVIVEDNPRAAAAGGDLLMTVPLNEDQVDELELRQRLDQLGDLLKERAWRQPVESNIVEI